MKKLEKKYGENLRKKQGKIIKFTKKSGKNPRKSTKKEKKI